MYYNPETKECLSRKEVKLRLNVSFPIGTEEINGWHLVDEKSLYPNLHDGQYASPSGFSFENGRWTRTYLIKDVSQNSMVSDADLETKYASLEAAFIELAQIVSDMKAGA